MQLFNRDQFDAPVFRVRKSLGLIWVTEDASIVEEEAGDIVEHGPFMDVADAFDQCDRPKNWHVEFF